MHRVLPFICGLEAAKFKKPNLTAATPPEVPPPKFELLPKIINGGIAGVIGVSVMFPLDLVKTRLQNQTVGNKVKQYKNILDCFKQTYAKEGYFGMYRGSAVNILLITPEKAIKLTANDAFRHYLRLKDGTLPMFRQMAAGGLAGACQIVVTTPMELLKIQMQDAGRVAAQFSAVVLHEPKFETRASNKDKKLTAMKITKTLLAERGVVGLYKGVSATAARDITFSIIYFPLFATLADLGATKPEGYNNRIPFWWSFVSGCCAACTAALIVNPIDVVKTRMQTINKGSGERQYSSTIECAKQILKQESITAFFKGGACRVMVVAPLFGIAQTVYYLGIAEWLFGL